MKKYLIAITFFAGLVFGKHGFAYSTLLGDSTKLNTSIVVKRVQFNIIADEKGIRRLPDVIKRGTKLKSVSIPVKLINNSSDTLKYMSWSCSWWDIYETDNAGVLIANAICEYNVPVVISLAPHKATVVKVPFVCNKSLIKKNLKIKIGMYLQTNTSTTLTQMIDKKEKDRLIWSNMVTVNSQ